MKVKLRNVLHLGWVAYFVLGYFSGELGHVMPFWLPLIAVPVALSVAVFAYSGGDADHDPNANRYDSILDLLRGFPDDWVIEPMMGRKNIRVGWQYTLHGKVAIGRGTYVAQSEYSYNRSNVGKIAIEVVDPETSQKYNYKPNREYAKMFVEQLRLLHEYNELKTIVNVSLEAQKKAQEKPLGTARKALRDFKKRVPKAKLAADTTTKG